VRGPGGGGGGELSFQCLRAADKYLNKYSNNGQPMISVVYGSPAAGSPNNWAAIVG
jgi:hypothetical protein